MPLIEDDVYGELAFDAARVNPAKAWDRDSTVLLCSSFTKTLAPGYRIGFVVPGRRWQEQIERLKFVTNVASPTLPQRALARYLSDGAYDRHLRTLRDRLSGIEASTASAVARHFPAGTRVSSPRGGCFLWVELPDGLDAMALHARALDVGVAISPGPIFSPPGRPPELHPALLRPALDRRDRGGRQAGGAAGRAAAPAAAPTAAQSGPVRADASGRGD